MQNEIDIVMPDSEDVSEAMVQEWLKKVGDPVSQHEPIVEVSTDKVTLEVAAPSDGFLGEILVAANESVAPGAILGRVSTVAISTEPVPEGLPGTTAGSIHRRMQEGKPPPEGEDAQAEVAASAGFRLSPLVRRILREHDLSPQDVRGTGRGGRITHQDVLAHIEAVDSGETPQPPRSDDTQPIDQPEVRFPPSALADVGAADGNGAAPTAAPAAEASAPVDGLDLIRHSPMRRKIAERMVESVRTSPHVTSIFDADLTQIIAHRNANKTRASEQGIKLTFTAYFVRAVADALRKVPRVNSQWTDDGVQLFRHANIGVATALGDSGLVVPVLRNAESLDLLETARALQEMTERARSGRLKTEDFAGGTFTITNHGVSGSLIATPIINQPQSAILGIGKLEKRVVVRQYDGQDTIQVRPMIYVTLTIDHRVLDGFQANAFLSAFVDTLQTWE